MKKVRLSELAKESEMELKEALDLAKGKLSEDMMSGRGGATWLTPEGAEILRAAMIFPEAIPQYQRAKVLKPAPNSKYVFAVLESQMKVPVLVPPRLRGRRLVGKRITVEIIENSNGKSYRYVKGE
jgi:hypothetical protein